MQLLTYKNILIGTLVRNRDWILPRFLQHLESLSYPKHHIGIIFLLNDNEPADQSKKILKQFQKTHRKSYRYIRVGEKNLNAEYADCSTLYGNDPKKRPLLYENLAVLRNELFSYLREDEQYFFAVDSDILLQPDTIEELMSIQEDMVSALVFNDWRLGKHRYPTETNRITNCMRRKGQPYRYQHIRDYQLDTVFPVDLTGACCLIHRKIIDAGCRYSSPHRQSEDVGFCHTVKEKGFSMYCNAALRPLHIMEPKFINLKKNTVENVPKIAVKVKPKSPSKQVLHQKAKPVFVSQDDITTLQGREGRQIWYPSTITFEWMVQRPQHILNSFAKDGYISWFSDHLYSKEMCGRDGFEIAAKMPFIDKNVRLIPAKRKVNGKTIIYISWPWNAIHAIKAIEARQDVFVWYDVIDDPAVFSRSKQETYAVRHDWLLQHADMITASAKTLQKHTQKRTNKKVHYLPNGCAIDHFRTCENDLPVPPELRNIDKPIMGFWGAVASWINWDFVEAAIKACPQFHFVVVGPNYTSNLKDFNKYKNFTRVNRPAPGKPMGKGVDFVDLPQFLKQFKACMVPFKFNDISAACSPLKFFEYLSSGKPIVSTAIPEIKPHKDYVYLAATEKGFISGVKKAMKENSKTKQMKRRKAADKFSWDSLYKTIRKHTEAFWK